jgi:hypothetical protein
MTDPECDEIRDDAAELALGILPGRDRARMIAHIERCPTCRHRVAELAGLADDLIALLPPAEPPVGFEARVLATLATGAGTGARPRSRWRTRRIAQYAAAVVLAAALAGGGWTVGHLTSTSPPQLTGSGPATSRPGGDAGSTATAGPRTVLFAPLTSAGTRTGQIYAYPGQPPWIYMAVDTETGDGLVSCQLTHRDGHPPTTVGTFRLEDGYGAWGVAAPVDPSDLAGAQLIDDHGTVLATASFT